MVCLVAASCGQAYLPKQARFTIGPCEDSGFRIASPGAWSVSEAPVLSPGEAGSWDSVDVLNPSVVRFRGELLNLYSGFDGSVWRSGAARSADGVSWERSQTAVLEPNPDSWEGGYIAANGSALAEGDSLKYWYQAGPRNQTRIGLARSADGESWKKAPTPVLGPGASGQWDETAVGDPYVVSCGQTYYLFYLGQNRFGVQRLGVARSPDGVNWQKSHLNPILETGAPGEFDENGLGEPAVFHSGDGIWMLYTGRDPGESRSLGWARSDNGVTWQKASGPGLFDADQPWNSAVVCDPTFLIDDNRLRVWFGGGDRPSPDENLNGRIGLAELGLVE